MSLANYIAGPKKYILTVDSLGTDRLVLVKFVAIGTLAAESVLLVLVVGHIISLRTGQAEMAARVLDTIVGS